MKKFKAISILKYLILFTFLILILTPIIMMILGSLKDSVQAMELDMSIPNPFYFENYPYVFQKGNILTGYRNSFIVTISTTLITVVTGGVAGIIIGRRKDRLATATYYYVIFGLTMTLQIASTFGLLKTLGIYGQLYAIILILCGLQMPFTIMTCTSFVKGIPRELDEAAIVDGCSPLQLIFRILFPILKPIIATNVVVTAIAAWNNFILSLFYLTSSKFYPVPMAVYGFFGQYASDWNYVFTALTLTVLPMIILFLFLQKYIIAGMTSGAVKG